MAVINSRHKEGSEAQTELKRSSLNLDIQKRVNFLSPISVPKRKEGKRLIQRLQKHSQRVIQKEEIGSPTESLAQRLSLDYPKMTKKQKEIFNIHDDFYAYQMQTLIKMQMIRKMQNCNRNQGWMQRQPTFESEDISPILKE